MPLSGARAGILRAENDFSTDKFRMSISLTYQQAWRPFPLLLQRVRLQVNQRILAYSPRRVFPGIPRCSERTASLRDELEESCLRIPGKRHILCCRYE